MAMNQAIQFTAILVRLHLICFLFILAGACKSWPGKVDTIFTAEFSVLAVAVDRIRQDGGRICTESNPAAFCRHHQPEAFAVVVLYKYSFVIGTSE